MANEIFQHQKTGVYGSYKAGRKAIQQALFKLG